MIRDAAIVSAYLDCVPGSADVLNDFLEEHGRKRIAQDVDAAGRLQIVLEEFLAPAAAQLLACEFAEHVFTVVSAHGYPPGATACAAKRQFLAGELTEKQLRESSGGVLADWKPDNSPESRAIWACWAAALATPSATAAAAQAASELELEWQIERVKQWLTQTTDSEELPT